MHSTVEPAPAPPAGESPIGWVGRVRSVLGCRGIDRVGRGTEISGRPYVSNDGIIVIGNDCTLSSHPIRSHLVTMPGARITIGNRVAISYGAAISSVCEVDIGDDSHIGPMSMILDNDFHKVGDRNLPGTAAPVRIGRGVHIGPCVTMLRGTRIGDGARVMAGSTVYGVVPAGAVVSGVPAQSAAKAAAKCDPAVSAVVMRVFRLAAAPSPMDGPGTIAQWTPSGAIRLLLALEEAFGIRLDARKARSVLTVAELSRMVMVARATATSFA
jgi:maltose O-acetyltransferase